MTEIKCLECGRQIPLKDSINGFCIECWKSLNDDNYGEDNFDLEKADEEDII